MEAKGGEGQLQPLPTSSSPLLLCASPGGCRLSSSPSLCSSPSAVGDVFLCVGASSTPLRALLYRLCCAVVEEQRRGRRVRSALPSYRARGLERLDQAVVLVVGASAAAPPPTLPRRLRALAGSAADADAVAGVWEEVQVRRCASLSELDLFFLSLSSLPIPPRLVLVDELPPPTPALPSIDWRTTYTALDSSLDSIAQATQHSSVHSPHYLSRSAHPQHHSPTRAQHLIHALFRVIHSPSDSLRLQSVCVRGAVRSGVDARLRVAVSRCRCTSCWTAQRGRGKSGASGRRRWKRRRNGWIGHCLV